MAAAFSPEDLKIHGPEGAQFSDIWGLTCAQLGVTLEDLSTVRPGASLREEDIPGYHFVQYGIDTRDTVQALDLVAGNAYKDWDRADALQRILHKIIGERSSGALLQRIRLGTPRQVEQMAFDPALYKYFDLVTEKDHRQCDALSLYPENDDDLEYRGRSSLTVKDLKRGIFLMNMTVYCDILDLHVDGAPTNPTIVVMSTSDENNGSCSIESVRIV